MRMAGWPFCARSSLEDGSGGGGSQGPMPVGLQKRRLAIVTTGQPTPNQPETGFTGKPAEALSLLSTLAGMPMPSRILARARGWQSQHIAWVVP